MTYRAGELGFAPKVAHQTPVPAHSDACSVASGDGDALRLTTVLGERSQTLERVPESAGDPPPGAAGVTQSVERQCRLGPEGDLDLAARATGRVGQHPFRHVRDAVQPPPVPPLHQTVRWIGLGDDRVEPTSGAVDPEPGTRADPHGLLAQQLVALGEVVHERGPRGEVRKELENPLARSVDRDPGRHGRIDGDSILRKTRTLRTTAGAFFRQLGPLVMIGTSWVPLRTSVVNRHKSTMYAALWGDSNVRIFFFFFAVVLSMRFPSPSMIRCQRARRVVGGARSSSAPMPSSAPPPTSKALDVAVADPKWARRRPAKGSKDRGPTLHGGGRARSTRCRSDEGWAKVGRSSCADIQLDDPTVSRRHALVVRTEDGRLKALDDRSLNGLFVNGKHVEWAALADGDELEYGGFKLYVLADAGGVDPSRNAHHPALGRRVWCARSDDDLDSLPEGGTGKTTMTRTLADVFGRLELDVSRSMPILRGTSPTTSTRRPTPNRRWRRSSWARSRLPTRSTARWCSKPPPCRSRTGAGRQDRREVTLKRVFRT